MRNFIKLSDSVQFGVFNSYIVGISSTEDGIKECLDFAKRVNCLHGTGCGVCVQCSKIDRGEHSDIFFLPFNEEENTEEQSSLSSIKIDDIRKLHVEAYLNPFEGKHRIFIVKNADRMTEQAQNSILKTLEESPSKTIIILLTDNVYGLLSTIRSRCRLFNYPFERKLQVNFREKWNEINNVAKSGIDVFFDYSKIISQSKESLIEFLEVAIVLVRDSVSIKAGAGLLSDGVNEGLKQLNFSDPVSVIEKLMYYSSTVKSRSINRELIAINSLSLLFGRI